MVSMAPVRLPSSIDDLDGLFRGHNQGAVGKGEGADGIHDHGLHLGMEDGPARGQVVGRRSRGSRYDDAVGPIATDGEPPRLMPKPMSLAMPWADTVASFMAQNEATALALAPGLDREHEALRDRQLAADQARGPPATPDADLRDEAEAAEVYREDRDAEGGGDARRVEDGPVAAQGNDEAGALGLGGPSGSPGVEIALGLDARASPSDAARTRRSRPPSPSRGSR